LSEKTSGDEIENNEYRGAALREWLLFQVTPQLLHQLRNHLTVVQNSHFTMKKALSKGDTERLERSCELGISAFQRAEGLLKTIHLFESGSADRLLDHYRSRFSNSAVSLEYSSGEETVNQLLPALIFSLEYLRSKMVMESRLLVEVEEQKIHLQQIENKEVVPPPILSDPLNHYFTLVPTERGWVIEKNGGESE